MELMLVCAIVVTAMGWLIAENQSPTSARVLLRGSVAIAGMAIGIQVGAMVAATRVANKLNVLGLGWVVILIVAMSVFAAFRCTRKFGAGQLQRAALAISTPFIAYPVFLL